MGQCELNRCDRHTAPGKVLIIRELGMEPCKGTLYFPLSFSINVRVLDKKFKNPVKS